jgi:RNA polymerase sigma-70 factor (ECF subfamily)
VDPQQLQEFAATEYGKVVAAVTIVCNDAAVAEDAVQEALARAVEKSASGTRIRNLAAWVTTVACNHTRSGFRRRTRERAALQRLLPEHRDVQDRGDRSEDTLTVHHAVRSLPRRQREAIVLRYFLGLDVAEVALELGVAEGTAKALLHQGRQRLRRALADPESHPDAGAGHHVGPVSRPPAPTAGVEP